MCVFDPNCRSFILFQPGVIIRSGSNAPVGHKNEIGAFTILIVPVSRPQDDLWSTEHAICLSVSDRRGSWRPSVSERTRSWDRCDHDFGYTKDLI